MHSPPSIAKPTDWLAAALVSAAPMLLLVLAVRQGIGLDWDAVVYLSAADSFAETGRLHDFYNQPLTTFAPGYPALLGLLLRTGLEFNAAGLLIAIVSLAVYVAATAATAKFVLQSTRLVWLTVALVSVSVSTVRVFAYLKTEALFVALVMLLAAACTWAIRTNRTPGWWIVTVALVVSIATSIRYVGFVFIPLVGLAVILAGRQRGTYRMLLRATVATCAATTGLAVVVVRNLSLGSPALGGRSAPTDRDHIDVLTAFAKVLSIPYVPAGSSDTVQLVSGIMVATLVVAGSVAGIVRRSRAAGWLTALVMGYGAAMIYSQLTTNIQPISERLLAPIFAPALLLAVYFVAGLLGAALDSAQSSRKQSVTSGTIPRVGAFAVYALVVVVSAVTAVSFTMRSNTLGLGYNSPASRESPTAHAVAALPPSAGLAAMNAPQVYVATRRSPIAVIPWVNRVSSARAVPNKIKALKGRIDSGEVDYLVWFKKDARHNVITPKHLIANGVPIRKVASLPDGSIWKPI